MQDHSFFNRFSLDSILQSSDYSKRRTKIVCTIGPSCSTVEKICEMIDAGMSVARLNFSHGDLQSHGKTVDTIREALKLRKSSTCAIMLDTKGPEIRTGLLKDHKTVELTKGQDFLLTTDYTMIGDNTKVACSYQHLREIKIGAIILIADGTIEALVKKVDEAGVHVEILNNAALGEKKNMNLPGIDIKLPTITENDEDALINFGLKKGVDMIALSFTRFGKDIEDCRDILGPRGSNIKIVAKIENHEGLQNYEQILEAADGIMVARGDLGMEIPPQKVFVAQKWMIKKANEAGKPIITATQMLESMIKNPRPTRAEASDVANAVIDGSDCVMLSGETANGNFPIECIKTMARCAVEAEMTIDWYQRHKETIENMALLKTVTPQDAMASSAVQLSYLLKTNLIVCLTETGLLARRIAKFQPKAYIVAISIDEHVIKALTILSRVITFKVPSFIGSETIIQYAIKAAKEMHICKEGDHIVTVFGVQEEHPEQANLLKIMTA